MLTKRRECRLIGTPDPFCVAYPVIPSRLYKQHPCGEQRQQRGLWHGRGTQDALSVMIGKHRKILEVGGVVEVEVAKHAHIK